MGDEALHAIDQVVVALAHGGGSHHAGVGTGVGLGLGERSALFPAQHGQQETLFLFVIAGEPERHGFGPEHAGAARRHGDGARHLLPHHHLSQHRQAHAAVFLGNVEHPQSKITCFLFQRSTHFRFEVQALHRLSFQRDEFAIDKFADGVLEGAYFFG